MPKRSRGYLSSIGNRIGTDKTLIIAVLVFTLIFPLTKGVFATGETSFVWLNPPAGTSTAPGTFTPSWSTVTDGIPRLLQTTYTYATDTCGTTWTDSGTATNGSAITLANLTCYRWTFDSETVSTARPPSLDASVDTPLTSGTLKVFDKSCRMARTWSGDEVTITWTPDSPTAGFDCKTQLTVPRSVGVMDLLVGGGGGAGGWAGVNASDGGGGGGGGGMYFSREDSRVTPGRTYQIQVGSGALVGTRNTNNISCRRANVDSATVGTATTGGTSIFGAFTAEGGGCAIDTGGNERGSDGGISANGRTGGRGGSDASRTARCTVDNGVARINLDRTTSFYTTAPCLRFESATAISGFGDGTGAGGNYWLNAWEGGGGGGGASFPTNADGTLNENGACVYGNPRWNFARGCDGWDISGRGSNGGIGGDGIRSTWHQGSCNWFFGGGGGGGGSTSQALASSGFMGWTFAGFKWEYRWNGTQNVMESVTASTTLIIPKHAPLGGPGGAGGGGHAATGTKNRTESAPYTYRVAQGGVDGCGGGGGGGQAWKTEVASYSATAGTATADLDQPGKGGNGIAVVRFSVSGANYGTRFNPSLRVPSRVTVWPNLDSVVIPVSLRHTGGNGFICVNLSDPGNRDTNYTLTSSIRFSLGTVTGASLSESQTATNLRTNLANLRISKSTSDFLVRDADGWVTSRRFIVRIRYSGSDEIANNTCTNAVDDVAHGGTALTQYLNVERIPATQVRSLEMVPKNGLENN